VTEVYGVFEGGGIRGTALVGAVAAAEDLDFTFRAVAGTSAGAIVASLIASGCKAGEIWDTMFSKDFNDFKDPVSRIPGLRRIVAWRKLGFHKGDEFQRWIAEQISFKVSGFYNRAITFRDLPLPLTVIAADVVNQQIKVFSRTQTAGQSVADAVRMSMSIPFFFCPVRYAHELIVDGGVLSNFPIWAFDKEQREHPLPILGFRLQQPDLPPPKICTPLDFARSLVNTVIKASTQLQIDLAENANIIELPTSDVRTTDFDISEEKKSDLYDGGYRTAYNYLSTTSLR
jgi:NTE family protein